MKTYPGAARISGFVIAVLHFSAAGCSSGGQVTGTGGHPGGAAGSGAGAGSGGAAGSPGGRSGGGGSAGGDGGLAEVGGGGGSGQQGGAGGRSLTATPTYHRATATVCSPALAEAGLPPASYVYGGVREPIPPDGGSSDYVRCSGSDCPPCSSGLVDRCDIQLFTCACDQCNVDQNCGVTGVCACNTRTGGVTPGNVCVPSNCRVDADCGPGGFCSPTGAVGCGRSGRLAGYYCHTPNDQCRDNADCSPDEACAYSPEAGIWICSNGHCAG
jgi:hypothetical protein